MKKLLFIIILGILLTGCGDTAPAATPITPDTTIEKTPEPLIDETLEPKKIENPDCRNAKWGMTYEEVMRSEGTEPLEKDENKALLYEDEILNFPVDFLYTFEDGKLNLLLYSFSQEHSNYYDYYSDYKKLLESYKTVYGETKLENENWTNSLYKGDEENIGMAVCVGHVSFLTVWDTETTRIGLSLSGDNYEVTLKVVYYPFDYEHKENLDGI